MLLCHAGLGYAAMHGAQPGYISFFADGMCIVELTVSDKKGM